MRIKEQGKATIHNFTRYNLHDNRELAKATGIKDISSYHPKKALSILENYYKVMFVRDPWERLLSAYIDKFTKINKYNEYFHMKYGRRIIKYFRKNSTMKSLNKGRNVTFPEFVKFVRNQWEKGERMNAHWAPMVKLCQPCKVQYDFIGKFETFSEDSSVVLSRITQHNCNGTISNTGYKHVSPTRKLLFKYYGKLNHDDLLSLQKIYHYDFRAFGYNELGPDVNGFVDEINDA